jgi:hypothetical protein
LCEREGIVHEVVPPYTPPQNGTAERKNMIIMNMVKSMLKGIIFAYKNLFNYNIINLIITYKLK